jgi:hypothetical protein
MKLSSSFDVYPYIQREQAIWKVFWHPLTFLHRIFILAGIWGFTWTIQTWLRIQVWNSASWPAQVKGSQWTFNTQQKATGTSCPSPMQVFYIPPCWKKFTAWRMYGRGTNVSSPTGGFSIPWSATFQRRASFWLALLQCGSYLVPFWSVRSPCGQYVTLHSSEIHMWALPDPGPCQIPMWSYLSSPIMVPMCFLCAPFVVLALSIIVHPLSAISLLRDSCKVPNRSCFAWPCWIPTWSFPVPFLVPWWSLSLSHRVIFKALTWL